MMVVGAAKTGILIIVVGALIARCMVLENRIVALSRDADQEEARLHAQLQKLKSADALRLKKVFGRQNACEEQHVRDVNTAAGLKAAVVDANSRMVAAQVREQRQRAAKTTDSVNDAGNDGGGVHDTVHVYNRTAWLPDGRFNVMEWESFTGRHIFSTKRIKGRVNRGGATKVETDKVIAFAAMQLGDPHFQFDHGMMRDNPLFGKEYLLDFKLPQQGGNKDRAQMKAFRRVVVTQPFAPELQYELEESDHDTFGNFASKRPIHAIMPLSGRIDMLRQFLEKLAAVALCEGCPPFYLHVVYYTHADDTEDTAGQLRTLLDQYTSRGLQSKIIPGPGDFSRGRGLELGAELVKDENALLFFVDVDMTFDEKFVHRCRSNPVRGRTVYYPTVFSLYENHVSIASEMQNAGLWREAGFGMVCLYRQDFFAIGGFDKKIEGWGKEDVDLFDRMVKKFDVIRGMDDGIFHEWHDKFCDPDLEEHQFIMCQGARANMEGDKMVLGHKLAQCRVETERVHQLAKADAGAVRSKWRSLPENPGYENKLKAETKKLGAVIDTISRKKRFASEKKAAEHEGANAVGGKYDKVLRKKKDAAYKSALDKKAAAHKGAVGSKKLQKPVLKSNYPDEPL